MSVRKKVHVPIPKDVAAALLFAADRTCCVCRVPGKAVQLHHIDENPANSAAENLAVLCLECHNQTQVSGGFGRTLDAEQVRVYVKDWSRRIIERRTRADELAVAAVAGPGAASLNIATPSTPPIIGAADYVAMLPRIRKRAYAAAVPGFDSGITAEMVEAAYSVIDVYETVLGQLASYFPASHFDGVPTKDYFSEIIAQRFRWHRALAEPDGPGTGGTIVGNLVASGVLADLESLIEDMVMAVAHPGIDEDFDPGTWRSEWDAAYPWADKSEETKTSAGPVLGPLDCPNCSTSARPFRMSPIPRDFVAIENATHECSQCQTKVNNASA